MPVGHVRPPPIDEHFRSVPDKSAVGPAEAGQARLVAALLAGTVVLQRFALPFGGGQVPLVLPAVLALVAWAAHRQILRPDPLRRQLFLVALLCCVVATTITSWRGLYWSPLSLIYLVATYLPFTFCLRGPSLRRYDAGLSLFLKLMYMAAAIGLAQVGLQLLGVSYFDPFDRLPSFLVLQGYQTSYPIVYGSSIFKANGMFFLEPSFYSQFLALALVICVYLHRRGLGPYLLMAGIVASVSGTGIILAVAGILAVGVTQRRRHLLRMAAGALAVAFLVALSPAGSIFTSRIEESSSSTSSAKGRFSVPYEVTAFQLSADPLALLTGRGPGDAERTSRRMEEATGVTAVFPVVAKLTLEYGVPALAVFLGFILGATLWRVPSVSLAVPLLVMYFTLSGSLLQPVTVYTVYALTSLFAGSGPRAFTGSVPANP